MLHQKQYAVMVVYNMMATGAVSKPPARLSIMAYAMDMETARVDVDNNNKKNPAMALPEKKIAKHHNSEKKRWNNAMRNPTIQYVVFKVLSCHKYVNPGISNAKTAIQMNMWYNRPPDIAH